MNKRTITSAAIAIALVAASVTAQESPVVNVNTATVAELDWLPGIGPAKADNIAYAREQGFVFGSVDDLALVHGIGPVTVEKLRPFVVVDGPTTATGNVGGKSGPEGPAKIRRPSDDS